MPLTEVSFEVLPAGSGSLGTLNHCVWIDDKSALGEDVFDVIRSLGDIALDIHGKPRGLRDGETEIQGHHTRNTAQADKNTPHEVDVDKIGWSVIQNGVFVSKGDEQSDQCSG